MHSLTLMWPSGWIDWTGHSRAQRWQEAHPDIPVRVATSPAEAAEGADVVLTCVGNDDDLADVVLGPTGVFTRLKRGAVFIDHTTASAIVARELHALAKERGWALSMRRCRAVRPVPRTACSR